MVIFNSYFDITRGYLVGGIPTPQIPHVSGLRSPSQVHPKRQTTDPPSDKIPTLVRRRRKGTRYSTE